MNLDLQAELKRRYPKFFRASGLGLLDSTVSDSGEDEFVSNEWPFDHHGIECDSGWFPTVDRLCNACELEIEALVAAGVAQESWLRVAQIKAKLGSLRFYINGRATDALRSFIAKAEIETRSTCEQCGKPGFLRDGSWRKTQCDDCYAEALRK